MAVALFQIAISSSVVCISVFAAASSIPLGEAVVFISMADRSKFLYWPEGEERVRSELKFSGFKVISSGTQSSGPADAKIIFRNALLLGAAKIVLAHNHPSANLQPSKADIKFTQKVIAAGKAIDIPVVDHLIVSHVGYVSMRAENHCDFEAFV